MATVAVYYAKGNKRSTLIAEAAVKGLKRIGDKVVLRTSQQYTGVIADYAVFYGLSCGLKQIMQDYIAKATAVYIDLGYWARRYNGRYDGHHKISVNNRHPTAYFQKIQHSHQRFLGLGVEIKPWRKPGSNILVAGMSHKAAVAEGLAPLVWERDIINELKQYTDKPVRFRPKPNCMRSRPIPGSTWQKHKLLTVGFDDIHAVLARHSNVTVDALIEGLPVYCEEGIASVMGMSDIGQIEQAFYPDDRLQWAADAAWCQFTPEEMSEGLPWRHLKSEGIIP